MGYNTTKLHVRVDGDTKEKAAAALNAVGLSVSEAIRLFLNRVVAEQGYPLDLKVLNAETRAAVAEADEIQKNGRARFHSAEELFADLEKNIRK